MSKYDRLSVWMGWGVFLISLVVYTLTLEPTVSLWDCGEFIATSYKLEVGHPPGTPLFFLINRIGALFAGDPMNVAHSINFLSGLESALTILFMFWSIVMLGQMMYRNNASTNSDKEELGILLAAFIGSMAYAFTDTFWFSAVEAEVYALSSLFTAVVVWAMLKWEKYADSPKSDRWLIFISYLMGLSIGAHILNLLTIPALTFIYFFKRFPEKKSPKQLFLVLLIGFVLTGFFYILTPMVVGIGAGVDRLFVNLFGLHANIGLALFVVVLIAALVYLIRFTEGWDSKYARVVNVVSISIVMVIIGFSSYTLVLIRSSVNPPMNSNAPSDPYALKAFLNREQYGSRPLIYGQSYASPILQTAEDNYETSYQLIKEPATKDHGEVYEYQPYRKLTSYSYDPKSLMLLPRMYSSSGNHVAEYKKWIGYSKGGDNSSLVKNIVSDDGSGNRRRVEIPTAWANIKFFILYQMNHMYWRYFLWNFVGRQSDIQSTGGIENGQWLSGIKFIDELYLGPQDNLPTEMANNKGRNRYFFLPFILGLIGLFFQLKKDGRGFSIVMLLFFMTGIAIILYLNQTPLQPRERDYAYAGSFYAFAIWIGFGVLCIYEWLEKRLSGKWTLALAVTTVLTLSVPTVLAVENWDDHDRSGRTVARDMGRNYLNSTLPNSVLINYGDNDTFPVWYAQEVEGVRTDVKVMNASYIQGGWYIDQMKMKSNESMPLPFTLPKKKYQEGAVLQFPVNDLAHPGGGTWTVKEAMQWVISDDPRTKYHGTDYDCLPSSRLALPVNKKNALESGIITEKDLPLVEDTIYIELRDNVITVDQLMVIDFLANFDWKRPVAFTSFGGLIDFGLVNISDDPFTYLQNDGFSYHLVPFKTEIDNYYAFGYVDTDDLYDKMMNQFEYGHIADSSTYIDSFIDYTISVSRVRGNFSLLALKLAQKGDSVRAVEVLDKVMDVIPVNKVRYDDSIISICEAYWLTGAVEKGDNLAENYITNLKEYLDYYCRFRGAKRSYIKHEVESYLKQLYNILMTASDCQRPEIMEANQEYFNKVYSQLDGQ